MEIGRVKSFLKDRFVSAKDDWIEHQPQPWDCERIYHQWLEQDWRLEEFANISLRSLPTELNLSLLNIEKIVFEGKYLLQINHIIEINKPLPTGAETEIDAIEEEEEEEEESLGSLFKKSKPNKKSFARNGPRVLEVCLTDGHQECVAIEYQSIPCLHSKLTGAKILLSGPFDVYLGAILLRKQNVTLVSEVTFDEATDSTAHPLEPEANSSELLELFADIDNFEPMDY